MPQKCKFGLHVNPYVATFLEIRDMKIKQIGHQ